SCSDRNPQCTSFDGRKNQSRTRQDPSRAAPLHERTTPLDVGDSQRSAKRVRRGAQARQRAASRREAQARQRAASRDTAASQNMKNLFGETTIRVLAFGALLLALTLVVVALRTLLVPFVAALFVVYLFDPAILFLERHGITPSVGFLVLLAFSLIAVGVILTVMPGLPFESLSGSSETFTERFINQLDGLERWANAKFPMFGSIRIVAEIDAKAAAVATRFFEQLPEWITTFVVNLVLVPFIAYFITRDGKTLKRRLVELVPNRYFEVSLVMLNRV